MARYRPLSDGLFEVETSAGRIPVPSTEAELQALGYVPDERTAFNPFQPESGGQTPIGDDRRLVSDALSPYQNQPTPPGPLPQLISPTTEQQKVEAKKAFDAAEAKKEAEADPFKPKTATIDLGEGPAPVDNRPRYATTKAKDVRGSFQVKKAKDIDPDDLEALDNARIDQKLAIQSRGDIEAARAERLGEVADRALAAQERQVGQEEIKLAQMRKEYARRQAIIDDERAEIDELKVDPDQVFSGDTGAIARVFAGISIIAGGALQGAKGLGSNPGLDAVTDAIDRNVQHQKEQIARRRQGLGGKETELERLMATYGNPEVAERELRNRQLALASAYAKRQTMNSSDDVRANVEASFADLDRQSAEERMAINQASQDDIVENWVHVLGRTFQVGGQAPVKEKDREIAVTLPGGGVKYARDPVQAREAQSRISAGAFIHDRLDELKAAVAKGRTDRLWWNENRGRIQATMVSVMAKAKEKDALGTLDAGVERLIEKGYGSPDAILAWDDATVGKLNANQSLIQKEIQNVIDYRLDNSPQSLTPGSSAKMFGKARRE